MAQPEHIFNVSGPPCTMREIVETISDGLGKRPMPGRVPASVAIGLGRTLSVLPGKRFKGVYGTVKEWLAEDVYDTSRFEEAYGFQTKIRLKDGLKREVDWYRQSQ